MSGTREKLTGARQLLDPILGAGRSLTRCALGHGDADAVLRGGLVRGTLHEIFARDAAASGFTACTAQLVSGAKRILWIVQDFAALEHGALSPSGFAELGIAPAKLLCAPVSTPCPAPALARWSWRLPAIRRSLISSPAAGSRLRPSTKTSPLF